MSYREILGADNRILDSYLPVPAPNPFNPNVLVPKGTILVGDGNVYGELPCPITNGPTATTDTFFNWLNLANGQSKTFDVTAPEYFNTGYSVTITYSATDFITGTITTVSSLSITLTITSFGFDPAYVSSKLIETNTNWQPSYQEDDTANPTYPFAPGSTVNPAIIPAYTYILSGEWYGYAPDVVQNPPPVPLVNRTINIPTGVQYPTSTGFTLPVYQNGVHTATPFVFPNEGCLILQTGPITLVANGNPPDGIYTDVPANGTTPCFAGSVSGYTIPYTPLGQITINSELVLVADTNQPLGVKWGVK